MGVLRDLLRPRPAVVRYGNVADMRAAVDGMSVAELYRTQPNLQAVIGRISRDIAQLPLKVYRRRGDDRVRDRDSTLARLLDRPNPDMTGFELIRTLVSDLKLYDFALWVVGRDSESDSGWQIRPIPPAWVVDRKGGNAFADETYYVVARNGSGSPVPIPAETCVVFHGYDPGSPSSGSTAIRALKSTIKEQMAAQRYRNFAWDRGLLVTGFISRPATVEPWTESVRNRFVEAIRQNWTRGGENAGGTPVLEDGMTYHTVEPTTREKDWVESVRLAREDVASAFGVNPAVIWPGNDAQTYATAKDNARSYYADTLSPDLRFIADRINASLTRILGVNPARYYAEFDLQAKLQGSFEEQVSSLQTSVGGPFMTRAEARARMNLPFIDGTDELIVPLNVVTGGLASPTDTDPTVERYGGSSRDACRKAHGDGGARHMAKASDGSVGSARAVLDAFWERQGKAVCSAMGASKARKAEGDGEDGDPPWWDRERWDRELAEDLHPVVTEIAGESVRETLAALGLDPEAYDLDEDAGFVEGLASRRARMLNDATLRDLVGLDDDESPQQVFDRARQDRSERNARTLATAVAAWATVRSAGAATGGKAMKTWVTGQNPRPTHAAMNGDTVECYGLFSNGSQWPGDTERLDVAEVANCNCTVEVYLP